MSDGEVGEDLGTQDLIPQPPGSLVTYQITATIPKSANALVPSDPSSCSKTEVKRTQEATREFWQVRQRQSQYKAPREI